MTLDVKAPRATIRDVAAEAKVSTSTVSLFIRGRAGVGDETAQRVAAAIEKLNYVPRPRTDHKQASRFFGFLVERLPVPVFSDIFYGEIIRGLEAKAKTHGYSMLFSVIEGDQLPHMVTEKQVAGLLILGGAPTNGALAVAVVNRGSPLVLVDKYIPGLAVDCIVPDNEWGGYAAFKHLIDLGHERIAIIGGHASIKR